MSATPCAAHAVHGRRRSRRTSAIWSGPGSTVRRASSASTSKGATSSTSSRATSRVSPSSSAGRRRLPCSSASRACCGGCTTHRHRSCPPTMRAGSAKTCVVELPADLPPEPPADIVSHFDVTPQNVVFRAGEPAALIDFDLTRPGTRLRDVVNTATHWVPLGRRPTGILHSRRATRPPDWRRSSTRTASTTQDGLHSARPRSSARRGAGTE